MYTHAVEIEEIAKKLKGRYSSVLDYVDLEKIYFAWIQTGIKRPYEVTGITNKWLQSAIAVNQTPKLYCIAFTYDYYRTNIDQGHVLEWQILEMLYSISPEMDGTLRKKDVFEYSRILSTLSNLGFSYNWRAENLPPLLGEEYISFTPEEEEE